MTVAHSGTIRDDVETELEALWREVLRVPDVPGDVSFFELGGNSLLAVKMLASTLERYKVDLDFPRFFGTPTLDNLVDIVRSRRG